MAIDTPATIAVLGAGPIGLEAALYGRYLGYEVHIYERGQVAEHVNRWGHVRMFTPFGENASTLGLAALKAQDANWHRAGRRCSAHGPRILSSTICARSRTRICSSMGLHQRTEVVAIGREGLLKTDAIGDETRGDGMFRLLLRTTDTFGHPVEHVALADIVIDVTGTLPVRTRSAKAASRPSAKAWLDRTLQFGLPDIFGRDRSKYAQSTRARSSAPDARPRRTS